MALSSACVARELVRVRSSVFVPDRVVFIRLRGCNPCTISDEKSKRAKGLGPPYRLSRDHFFRTDQCLNIGLVLAGDWATIFRI